MGVDISHGTRKAAGGFEGGREGEQNARDMKVELEVTGGARIGGREAKEKQLERVCMKMP